MTEPSQLNEYDMRLMTPEQIGKAHKAGRFRDLLDPDIAPTLPLEPMGTPDQYGDPVTEPTQLTAADIAGMSQSAIAQALREGRCRDLLNPPTLPTTVPEAWPEGQLTKADLEQMRPEEIVDAKRAGRCDYLLGGGAMSRPDFS